MTSGQKRPLRGQMMAQPLLISNLLAQADRHYGDTEIVSRRVEGDTHRYTYRDCHRRARTLANALSALGAGMGDRIGGIDLENVAMQHPDVEQAACIGVPHPKWDERPLLVVVKKQDAAVTRDELLAFYEGKVAKWWRPDDVVFVESLPIGATGKVMKNVLRTEYGAHVLSLQKPF